MPFRNIVLSLSLAAVSALHALSLKDSVEETLSSNPIVAERLSNYRATLEDVRSAEAGYLPTLDWVSGYGVEKTRSPSTNFETRNYKTYEHSLILTQNIFNGLGTKYQIDYQKARLLAAANHFLEKSNDVTFNLIRSYIEVLKNRELVEIAKENVKFNEDIFIKVNKLYKAGLTTRSEAEKGETSYSLAKSNLIVAQNNLADTLFTIQRILGRNVMADELEKIVFDPAMPISIEEMNEYSITHNPSILVSQYNIKAAQSLWDERHKNYYPKIDFTARQSYSNNVGGIEGRDDRFKAMVTLSYNLYRGGADESEIQKNVSKIHQEHQIKNDLKRQVIEQGQLSWSANKFLGEQLVFLQQYKKTSEKTVELYQKEYDLGRRTLLDLLVAENDFIASKTQITKAEYDRLLAKFRILDAMGIMVTTIMGDKTKEYTAKVGLKPIDIDINKDKKFGTVFFSNRKSPERQADKLPFNTDADNDSFSDTVDQCDNTIGGEVTVYGCRPEIGKQYPVKIFRSVDKKDEANKFNIAQNYIKQNKNTIQKVLVKTYGDPYAYDENTLRDVNENGVQIANKIKKTGIEESKIVVTPFMNQPIASSERRVGEKQNFRSDVLIFEENGQAENTVK